MNTSKNDLSYYISFLILMGFGCIFFWTYALLYIILNIRSIFLLILTLIFVCISGIPLYLIDENLHQIL